MPYTDLDNYTIGNSIIINPHTEVNFNPCALSKYVVISGVSSRNSIIYNGDNINPSDSIYTEILACVLSSINKISPKKENKILVLGCGLIGILHLKILKMLGFKNIFCSYNKIERTKIIQDMGFKSISLDEIMARKYDVIFECVGKEELVSLAIRVSNDKCSIILFGGYDKRKDEYLINLNDVHYRNLKIIGTYHFEEELFKKSFDLISQKKIDFTDLKTHTINFKNFKEEYSLLEDESILTLGIEFEEIE